MTFGNGKARDRRRMLAVVAVVAAAIGITVALLIQNTSSRAAAAGNSTPAATAPAPSSGTQGGSGLPALQPLSGNGDGKIHLMLAGKVLAISSSSITIGGNGPLVTAAISKATEVTGDVTSVSGIKVGDEIGAQVSGTSSTDLTADSIQDPVSGP